MATGLNVQNKLALLIALAKRPAGRATLDELRNEVAVAETDKQIRDAEQLYSFDHVDVFQTGLVVSDDDSLLITDRGYSLLRALGIVTREPPDLDPLSTVQSLNLIDDLIGSAAHRKMFQSRSNDQDADGLLEETTGPETPPDHAVGVESLAHETHPDASDGRSAARDVDEVASAPPDFLMPKFGAEIQRDPGRSNFRATIATLMKRGRGVWRGHLRQGRPSEATGRSNAKAERLLFAFLSLLVFVSCACATIAFMQVRSTRSELAALQRELLPLKERLARLEQSEKGRETSDKPGNASVLLQRWWPTQQSSDAARPGSAEAPLLLSHEEIQLIRDVIKPAPVAVSSMPPIVLGDPVAGPTIPLPSSITEKVPKLIGARFTIRNGAIVIVRKDSLHADAVLGQN